MRIFLGSETASAGSKTGSRQSLSPPLRMARKGFMKWNACVDHSDSLARINLVVKVFLYFLIILSPTHNHASLEMSDEPEGLPVRDEVASIVTMLQCYMLHVTLRSSHCALPPRAGRVERAGDGLDRRAAGVALAGGRQGSWRGSVKTCLSLWFSPFGARCSSLFFYFLTW